MRYIKGEEQYSHGAQRHTNHINGARRKMITERHIIDLKKGLFCICTLEMLRFFPVNWAIDIVCSFCAVIN